MTRKYLNLAVGVIVVLGLPGIGRTASADTDRAISSGTSTKLDQYKVKPTGVAFDDSLFVEPLVRDQRDQSYGALANPAMRPLGGDAAGEAMGAIDEMAKKAEEKSA